MFADYPRLRSGKEIGEDKEQTLKAKNKKSWPNPISFRVKLAF